MMDSSWANLILVSSFLIVRNVKKIKGHNEMIYKLGALETQY